MDILLDEDGQPVSSRLNRKQRQLRDANQMIGMCRGIIFDSVVNEIEAKNLMAWLESHPDVIKHGPGRFLLDRLIDIFEDDQLDKAESEDLLALLTLMAGGHPAELEEIINYKTGEITKPSDSIGKAIASDGVSISFEGKVFVLTGMFQLAPRAEIASHIKHRGGVCEKRTTQRTDYLVIANKESRDWSCGPTGNKINYALKLQQNGQDIYILTEDTLMAALDG